MIRYAPLLLAAGLAAGQMPENLAPTATVSASTQADATKYGAVMATDGRLDTHWASAGKALPQSVTLTWDQPRRFDTVRIDPYAAEQRNLYAAWTALELRAGETVKTVEVDPAHSVYVVRFDAPVESRTLILTITAVEEPKFYVGIDEIGVFLDPEQRIMIPPSLPRAIPRAKLRATRREVHPCVYENPEDIARARKLAAETAWGKEAARNIVNGAEQWLSRSEAEWRKFLPPPGACYAYGFIGSPKNGARWGTWGGARCSWDKPGKVTCPDGQEFPNDQYPDTGGGYHNPDGRVHYMVGSWNAWVTEQWTNAVLQLGLAHALTGDEKYADRAGFFLDLLASIYPESSAGSWDYPSRPPSGRFARPWYQVARVLIHFVRAYDLVFDSASLEKPSLRPELERTFPPGPWLQQREVGTTDRHGVTHPGMTRRENIEQNLIWDGSQYCYEHTFGGALHNGHADYMRGALAGGAVLGIPEMVLNAIEGPYSIRAMIANNCDRDGRYYETSLMYAIHARDLYLTYLGPLKNWRDAAHPEGFDLVSDSRFRSFYRLPWLTLMCAGHSPNFGDTGPDNGQVVAPRKPFERSDYLQAEELYAAAEGPAKDQFAAILRWLAGGDVERLRAQNVSSWNLFHAEPVPDGPAELPAELHRHVFESWFVGQKGMALLRDGEGQDAQAALLRFGPSLNHGDLDDLGLIYYAKGWQTTYEIGYGLGSTHTQVGWGSQTASHTIVTVNEQSQHGPGSGGSLHLFGRLPGLKLVEADSPLSYSSQQVSEYRRTVALLGTGQDQVLVDLFRVTGGRQHDYLVGSQRQEQTVTGVELGEPGQGSLAGDEPSWGTRQGLDGDIIGQPNKPYWNPPPGTGYGFFYEPRRGAGERPWTADWKLGGYGDAHFAVTFLPESGSEAIVAKAPGLYPNNDKASYGIVRRRGEEGLRSAFASVMAPYARPAEPGILSVPQLFERVVEATGEYRVGSGYGGYLFFKGAKPGDHLEVEVELPAAAEYDLTVEALLYVSYGKVQVSLDGRPVGQPLEFRAAEAKSFAEFELGRQTLTAGKHRFRFALAPGSDGVMFGLQGLLIRQQREQSDARPVVTAAERLAVAGDPDGRAVAVHLVRAGRDEYLLSAVGAPRRLAVKTPRGELSWTGGVAYLAYQGDRPVAAGLLGCAALTAPGIELTPATGAYEAKVTAVDVERNTVDVDVELPVKGLAGEAAIFHRPEWSRTSGYRIASIAPQGSGSRISLGEQSMLLGQVRVMAIDGPTRILSDIPHDYTKSVVGGAVTRFFDGKRLVGQQGGETRVTGVQFAQPMPIEVEDAGKLKKDDILYLYDLGPGDGLTIPTSLWAEQREPGWTLTGSVAAKGMLGGKAVSYQP